MACAWNISWNRRPRSHHSHEPRCNPASWMFLALFVPFVRRSALLATVVTRFPSLGGARSFPPFQRHVIFHANALIYSSLAVTTPVPSPFLDAVVAVAPGRGVGVVRGGISGSSRLRRVTACFSRHTAVTSSLTPMTLGSSLMGAPCVICVSRATLSF